MHLIKNCLNLKRIRASSATRNVLWQNIVFRRSATSASGTVEQAEARESTVKSEEKNVMKEPFAKNLFSGKFVQEMLEYPEYPNIQVVNQLVNSTNSVEEFIVNSVDSYAIDEKSNIPEDVHKAIKEFNLYGLQSPSYLGGQEADSKTIARYFESIGSDANISALLVSHHRSLNTLLRYGTEAQKEIARKLTSGEANCAFCLIEKPHMVDLSHIDTEALPDKNNNWILNGKKIWVTNGNKADYFLVFAKTSRGPITEVGHNSLTIFLVDKNASGVQCSGDIEQLGTKGVSSCDVTFNDVFISKENQIGEIGDGANIAIKCLSNSWLNSAAATVGYLKKLLNSITEFAIHTKIGDKPLYTHEYFQVRLGQIVADIYALESMVYLTAGIKDTFDDPDLSLEESIVKIYSTEKIVEIVDLCANLVGGTSYLTGSQIEKCIRDSRSYLLQDAVPLNITKIYLATQGLHHAGKSLMEEVRQARSPAQFPSFAFKNLFNRNPLVGDHKAPDTLRLNIHPSLACDADKLESCVLCLHYVVKNLFQRWGGEVVNRHMDLIRLTDCIVSLYAMTATMSRASRSYCIGLANSNHELVVSNTICGKHHDKVKSTLTKITDGPLATFDTLTTHLGRETAEQKGYFFEHPIARNY